MVLEVKMRNWLHGVKMKVEAKMKWVAQNSAIGLIDKHECTSIPECTSIS